MRVGDLNGHRLGDIVGLASVGAAVGDFEGTADLVGGFVGDVAGLWLGNKVGSAAGASACEEIGCLLSTISAGAFEFIPVNRSFLTCSHGSFKTNECVAASMQLDIPSVVTT